MIEILGMIIWISFIILLIASISVLGTIFWIWMLIDSIKRKYKNDSDKIIWVLVIIFTGLIGAILYYFVVRVNKNEDLIEQRNDKKEMIKKK